ncbi:DUF6624 domain-containing protein [Flavobacterium sp. FlaQc-48]|uniref:DUF6624 domain-containing protein n=1 Tax=Flavobacterium sp. FlaQc-48 TaxID=3374181 RepID=UPI00375771FE
MVLITGFRLEAQVNVKYETLLAEANLSHLQKNYADAVTKFEQAAAMHELNALNLYKLSAAYSSINDLEAALKTIGKSLGSGCTEADLLVIDGDFDNLRKAMPEKWIEMVTRAIDLEKAYQQTLGPPQLRKKINSMTYEDQRIRRARIVTSDTAEIQKLTREINASDLKNLTEARKIIERYGWPKKSEIGKDGQNNLWLIVQHADQDIELQKLALHQMEKLLETHEIDLENFAFLYDRVQCNLNYKQLYGTQVIWTSNGQASGFRPIIKQNRVNERRRKLGLLPLEIYGVNYGFHYNEISRRKASLNDRSTRIETKKIIAAAKSSFEKGEFEKVYDYYNSASMILGGMTDKQNYKAAVIFARIYNRNAQEKYKSISLDFLTLLKFMDKLNIQEISEEKEFDSFHSEWRWIQILK